MKTHLFTALIGMVLMLNACAVAVPNGLFHHGNGQDQVSPAAAKAAAARVVNPADIPRGFTDCVGGHSADSRYHEDETGTSYSVDEFYSRNCKDIPLAGASFSPPPPAVTAAPE